MDGRAAKKLAKLVVKMNALKRKMRPLRIAMDRALKEEDRIFREGAKIVNPEGYRKEFGRKVSRKSS